MENVTSDLLTDILLDSIIFIGEIYMQMQFSWYPCRFGMGIFHFCRRWMDVDDIYLLMDIYRILFTDSIWPK